jgi:hypothetical protein
MFMVVVARAHFSCNTVEIVALQNFRTLQPTSAGSRPAGRPPASPHRHHEQIMKKSRMTIRQRLATGFGAVFLLMIVLTALAISRVNSIDTSLNRINDVNNVKQRYAINFRGSVHDRAIAVRDVVLAAEAGQSQATARRVGNFLIGECAS